MHLPLESALKSNWEFHLVYGVVCGLCLIGIMTGILFAAKQLKFGAISWRERAGFLRHIPLSETPALLLIAGIFLAHIILIGVAGRVPRIVDSEWGIVTSSLAMHWFIVVFVLVWKRSARFSWKDAFGFERKRMVAHTLRGLVAYLIAIPVIFVVTFLYRIVLLRFGYPIEEQQPIVDFLTGNIPIHTRIYGIILAVCVAPVAEELLFRGILLPLMTRITGVATAIIVTSLLFAGMHLFIPAIATLFFVSLTCSFAYIYTGSLTTPITFHAIFNAINLVIFFALKGSSA